MHALSWVTGEIIKYAGDAYFVSSPVTHDSTCITCNYATYKDTYANNTRDTKASGTLKREVSGKLLTGCSQVFQVGHQRLLATHS